jgi:hypothetical protein
VADEPEQLLALGAADFLRKPVSGARLREAVLRALDRTPVPLFVLDGDDARRERVRRALEETGLDVSPARTWAIGDPPPAPVISVSRPWMDKAHSHAMELIRVRDGGGLDTCGESALAGRAGSEILRGQRAADAAGRVRALIAARRGPKRDRADG